MLDRWPVIGRAVNYLARRRTCCVRGGDNQPEEEQWHEPYLDPRRTQDERYSEDSPASQPPHKVEQFFSRLSGEDTAHCSHLPTTVVTNTQYGDYFFDEAPMPARP